MFFGDNSNDSDDLPLNPKAEYRTPSFSAEIENLLKEEVILTPWKQITDKFRKCLLTDLKSSTIVEFLDSFLKFIRKGPKDCRDFTTSICNYLVATKHLASKEAVDESYYDHMRHVLVLYCLLELRLISCFDDDSMVASDIFFKITLLMQGSNSTAILDVLIDIDEEIRGYRSISIMKIIYRKYLTKTLVGGQIELEDNSFVKHLIVFHSWYKAESSITEKTNVLKFFLSAIKPSQQLRSNPAYSNSLPAYNPDEVGGYRRLLQETILRKNLIIALRDAERQTDCQDVCENVNSIDLTVDDEPVIKSEVNPCLNLPNEVISIDDDGDEDDSYEISYLQKLYEKVDDFNRSEQRLSLQRNVPIDTIDIGSDSEVEINEKSGDNPPADVDSSNSINDSTDFSSPPLARIDPNNSSHLKTDTRKRDEVMLMKTTTQYRRKTVPINESMGTQETKIQPILRMRSCTNTIYGKSKKVTFIDPPATTYVFERCDYGTSVNTTQSDQRISDFLSSYIVTGPQCNFPYGTTGAVIHAPPSPSPETQIDSGPNESTVIKARKYRKRKRSQNYNKCKRTSLDDWIRRKKVNLIGTTHADSTVESKMLKKSERTVKKNSLIGATDLNVALPKCQKCRVVLRRCSLPQSNETNVVRVAQRLSFNEDMTLKEIIEAKERKERAHFQNPIMRQSNNLSGAVPVTIQNYFPPPAVASKNLISPKLVIKKTVKSSKKSSSLLLSGSKSKSVIKSVKGKSTKRMKSTCKASKKPPNNAVRSAVKTAEKVDVKLSNCFVLLENLKGTSWTSKANSSKKPHRRTNNQLTSDTNFRLPTKSPQEYQFKRSFEKIPVYEKDSTAQFPEIASPIITMVTSISSEQLIANDLANQPSQSIHHVLDSTTTSPQLEITLQPSNSVRTMFINQPSETISDVETEPTSLPLPPLSQSESSNEVDNCETLSTINCTVKSIREVTSCSPDTTTSSTPQLLLTPDKNDSPTSETIEETECNETATSINCDKNCDNDIPSPVYSPYEGRRKNDTISTSKIAFEFESVGDAVTPIDLRLKVMNDGSVMDGVEINDSTNTTISSSQPTLSLIDELNSASL